MFILFGITIFIFSFLLFFFNYINDLREATVGKEGQK